MDALNIGLATYVAQMAVLGFAAVNAYVMYGLALWAVGKLGVVSGRFENDWIRVIVELCFFVLVKH